MAQASLSGTTSAYAEKSQLPPNARQAVRNYLRIRGEEATGILRIDDAWELPPHTRRREGLLIAFPASLGTTSAYAEKSDGCWVEMVVKWNYLRIRGEEPTGQQGAESPLELPPHTRRRASAMVISPACGGTTSAYAEKRAQSRVNRDHRGNYLRIRGEEIASPSRTTLSRELPPHTRRRVFG